MLWLQNDRMQYTGMDRNLHFVLIPAIPNLVKIYQGTLKLLA
jgi:hypothetical protein